MAAGMSIKEFNDEAFRLAFDASLLNGNRLSN